MANFPFGITELAATNVTNFEQNALALMQWQLQHNPLYAKYDLLVKSARQQTPFSFLPVSFFKNELPVVSGKFHSELIFTSSSTTGTGQSYHHVPSAQLYEWSIFNGFRQVYGHPGQYIFFALLPSYLERTGSSLVWMTQKLIEASGHPLSGFYLHNFEELHAHLLQALAEPNRKIFLLGVSFALLDFATSYPINLANAIVMETGGMKGRRKEITRAELHSELSRAFGCKHIHSEYGMTEMLSQAYATADGRFIPANTMKVYITDINDPFRLLPAGKAGCINIVDLCNMGSCAFIQTTDIGMAHADGSFEVLGRLDHSDLRGCSLMYV